MQIYVLRHGIAEDAAPGRPDSDRALTSEGRDKLRRVLRRAAAAGVEPSLVLSSPYKRAVETAAVAVDVLKYRGKIAKTPALLPAASPPEIWEEIRSRKEESAILLASHEPLTGRLVSFLLDSPALQVEMKKAALVRVDFERLSPEPRGILKWMITPALAAD
jgi:phosphohistidine phosphatase